MSITKTILRLLLGRRLPIISGTIEIPGIDNTITIRRDTFGIAYIEAEGEDDAWYGLGFCHGQDRPFQLETLLRVIRGTLSEILGSDGVPIDRISRRVGFDFAAKQQLEIIDPEIRKMLEAYARGVTDGQKVGRNKKGHEFTLLRTEPTPYLASDVLGVISFMSFSLPANWDCELVRLKVLTEEGPEALKFIDPKYQEWLPTTSLPQEKSGKSLDALIKDLSIFTEFLGLNGGSNNWVISSSRTATKRPILANDPHIAPSLPPYMYLTTLRCKNWAISGASFVGGPVFTSGHNGFCAWGMTAGMQDNTDLFLEEIDSDGESIRHGDDFKPCEIRTELIKVKGKDTIEEKILNTPRGPIIGPALDGEVGAISICAPWLQSKPVQGLFQLHNVKSFEDFRRAFSQWPALPFNMVYADESDNIGWQLAGETPIRRKGFGTIPLPGWDLEIGWEKEPVSFDKMPYMKNPEFGFIATANNKPIKGDDPFLGVDWIDGYRATRIMEIVGSREDWDIASVSETQLDQKSIPWRELRDIILDIPAKNKITRKALTLLEAWDGKISAESSEATIFELFVTEMIHRIVKKKAPISAEWLLGKGFSAVTPFGFQALRRTGYLIKLLREQPSDWFDHSWPEEMADVLITVMNKLEQKYGTNLEKWKWGHIRPLTLKHPMGDRKPFDGVYNIGPLPFGSDAHTIAHGSVNLSDPLENPLFIPVLRMVIDVGNWDNNRFALPGGQSENPFSPHYSDQVPYWLNSNGLTVAWSQRKIEEKTKEILQLTPK